MCSGRAVTAAGHSCCELLSSLHSEPAIQKYTRQELLRNGEKEVKVGCELLSPGTKTTDELGCAEFGHPSPPSATACSFQQQWLLCWVLYHCPGTLLPPAVSTRPQLGDGFLSTL